jgi:hypothetical protein
LHISNTLSACTLQRPDQIRKDKFLKFQNHYVNDHTVPKWYWGRYTIGADLQQIKHLGVIQFWHLLGCIFTISGKRFCNN